MANSMRTVLSLIVVVLGVSLMVGGIMTGKYGAVVIGLITAAVSMQRWKANRN